MNNNDERDYEEEKSNRQAMEDEHDEPILVMEEVGNLDELTKGIDAAWPQAMPASIMFVRAELNDQMYIVHKVELRVPTEGETIVFVLREVNDRD